jgi:hypothetical protein
MPQPHTGELQPSGQQLWTFDSGGNLIVAGGVYAGGVPDQTVRGPGQPLAPGRLISGLAPSNDESGVTDQAAISELWAKGAPFQLLPGVFWTLGLEMFESGQQFNGAGPQRPGNPGPGTRFATIIRGGTLMAPGTPLLTIPVGVSACQVSGIAFNGQLPFGAGNAGQCINLPDDENLDNNYTLIYAVSAELSGGTDGIYIGHNRAVVTLRNVWSYNHAGGAAINVQGSGTVVDNSSMSGSLYGFILSGATEVIGHCQIFSNTGNLITGGNAWLHHNTIDHTGGAGLSITNGDGGGVSIHGRFEGNSETASGAAPHIDASGAGVVAGAGSQLASGSQGSVTIAPGTHFTTNAFGGWKVNYDIFTGGHPEYVNDFSTYDADTTSGHIDS